jgi:putative ABC transport system substrate-binding protein
MKLKRGIALLFLIPSFLTMSNPARSETVKVLSIMSRRITPFTIALEGFKKAVGHSYEIYDFSLADEPNVENIKKIVRKTSPQLILAIGITALNFAKRNIHDIPIVFTMVSNPSYFVMGQKNISGIRMETPWEIIFKHLIEIAPDHKRAGIILNPEILEEDTDYIKRLAENYGIIPIIREVENTAQAISEFKNIEQQIDAFLMVPDPYIFNPKFYEYILLASLRNKFVLVGLSTKHTKTGSLFSIIGDNHDWGYQAGLMSKEILSGVNPERIPYGFANKFSLCINLKTARKIGVKIPPAIEKEAKYIVE